MKSTERFCDNPPPAALNGGLKSWDDYSPVRPAFQTKVTYTCDTGRRIDKTEDFGNGTVEHNFIDEQVFECQWNQTWSPNEPVNIYFLLLFGHCCFHL